MQVWAFNRTMPIPSPYLADMACTSFFAMISCLPTAWAAKRERGEGATGRKSPVTLPLPRHSCAFPSSIVRLLHPPAAHIARTRKMMQRLGCLLADHIVGVVE